MPNKTGWPRRFTAPPTGPLHVFISGNVTPPSVVPLILVDAGTYSPVQNTVVHPEIAEGLSPTQGCSSRYGDVLTLSMFALSSLNLCCLVSVVLNHPYRTVVPLVAPSVQCGSWPMGLYVYCPPCGHRTTPFLMNAFTFARASTESHGAPLVHPYAKTTCSFAASIMRRLLRQTGVVDVGLLRGINPQDTHVSPMANGIKHFISSCERSP